MGIYFEWGLFVCFIASVIITLVDQYSFLKQRLARARAADPAFDTLPKKERQARLKGPFFIDYARSLWPVFLIVFVIRSFIFEPYIVPSGSMLPTIQLGDFVYANKFAYGIRLPLINTLLVRTGEPREGDVALFRSPFNPQVNFIKTIVGVPGDSISYINKRLFINGKPVPTRFLGTTIEPNNANLHSTLVASWESVLGGHTHTIYNTPAITGPDFRNLVVPPHEYFAMGDNRDNSDDSRSWGFVPEANLLGKAEYIFLSYDSSTHRLRWSRMGTRLP
jgi:signal peptidase I